MLVRFSCHAQLPLGQYLKVTSSSHAELDGLVLRWGPDNRWEGDCELPVLTAIQYGYTHEKHAPERTLFLPPAQASTAGAQLVMLYDELNIRPDRYAYSTAFAKVFFAQAAQYASYVPVTTLADQFGSLKIAEEDGSLQDEPSFGADKGSVASVLALSGDASTAVTFALSCWRIGPDTELRVAGSLPVLGDWNHEKAPKMPFAVPVYPSQASFEFKFVLINTKTGSALWETGPNRKFVCEQLPRQHVSAIRVECGPFRFPTHYGSWRAAGMAIPVFSMRSKSSCGVGEFQDIPLFAKLCAETGLRLLQLLPVNDTRGSYPYGCLSVFALNPIYIHLPSVFAAESSSARRKELEEEYPRIKAKFEDLEDLDFDAVVAYKLRVLRELYRGVKQPRSVSGEEQKFYAENKDWLPYYAEYRRKLGPLTSSSSSSSLEDAAASSNSTPEFDIDGFWEWIQFHAHLQLLAASEESRKFGVALKGDLPIGVAADSCDATQHPELFHLECCAGAPPDYFSKIGQNWGFPTYKWEAHEADGYRWWRRRLEVLGRYFHAIRIDHVLGLFRIWSIPRGDVTGMRGRFVPSIPITRAQLEAAGIWDIERLVMPEFEQHEVPPQYVSIYFDITRDGKLRFKPEFMGESQLPPELYEYLSDVCLLAPLEAYQASNGKEMASRIASMNEFWPRFDLQTTRCFRKIPWEWQRTLDGLRKEHFFGAAQNELWRENGNHRLQMLLAASDMLLCAEDLGLIPDCVPEVLNQLQILCLKIQRMPRETWAEFDHPHTYPYLSVCAPCTHDMSTLRGWWEEDRARSQRFYESVMGCTGPAPQFAEPWVCRRVLSGMLHSNAMLSIFAIQDWLACDGDIRRENPFVEQINVPANPKHVWKYRLHVNVEDLLTNRELISEMRQMVLESGRFHASH
eukprot:ANDGO_00029.mRNA.1 4-alpha-glucanotransferase DPE2